MLKVLIISDTHGSSSYIDQILHLCNTQPPDEIWHLGDNYEDTLPFLDAGYAMERIPGTWDREYQDPFIDNRQHLERLGWRVFITHTPEKDSHDRPEDPDPQAILNAQNSDVFMHGHTHKPDLYTAKSVTVLNPGHLKQGDNRGYPPSYAWMTMTPSTCEIEILELGEGSRLHHTRLEK